MLNLLLAAGAILSAPIQRRTVGLSIDFKPKLLYQVIDEKIVEPARYQQWER